MMVYHAGTERIATPRVDMGRANLDFGTGFYVTNLLEQATKWSERMSLSRGKTPVINQYELDVEAAAKEFVYKKFEAYDREWLDFIVANRRGGDNWKSFDIVEGGVADDRVIDTVELFIGGFIPEELAIERLQHFAPNNQLCITNQHVADKYIRFIDSFSPKDSNA